MCFHCRTREIGASPFIVHPTSDPGLSQTPHLSLLELCLSPFNLSPTCFLPFFKAFLHRDYSNVIFGIQRFQCFQATNALLESKNVDATCSYKMGLAMPALWTRTTDQGLKQDTRITSQWAVVSEGEQSTAFLSLLLYLWQTGHAH